MVTRKIVLVVTSAIFVATGANIGIHMWFRHDRHQHMHHGGPHGHPHGHLPTVPSLEELTEFLAFEKEYGRSYGCEQIRAGKFSIFRENLSFINAHNAKPNKTFTLKVNEFADIHFEEFRKTRLGLRLDLRSNRSNYMKLDQFEPQNIELPDSIDWVEKGGVSPVKNQGSCGSCWSFSTTGALEGAWFAKHNQLVSLSEQEFVDCDVQDNGCNGGLMDNAFQYAENNDICTEDSYAYHAEEGKCQMAKEKCTVGLKKGSVLGFRDVKPHSEQALMEALTEQSVSVAIEADKQVFQFYHDGVLSSEDCGTQLDHGVLAVGYGTYTDPASGEQTKYWKVKNSWGPGWGKDGFIRISREPNMDDLGSNVGVCGIMTLPSFPVLSSAEEPATSEEEPAQEPDQPVLNAKITDLQAAQAGAEDLYV